MAKNTHQGGEQPDASEQMAFGRADGGPDGLSRAKAAEHLRLARLQPSVPSHELRPFKDNAGRVVLYALVPT
jgi:hypothetical protein